MSESAHDLSGLATEWAKSAGEDLSGLVGTPVVLVAGKIDEGARNSMLASSGTLVHTGCKTQDGAGVSLGLAMPLRAAQLLAAAKLGKGPGEFEALAAGGFEGEVAEAHSAVMDLCVGILGRVFAEEASLPGLELGETHSFEAAEPGDAIAEGQYRRAGFKLQVEGFPDEHIDLLLPGATALEWFGPCGASGSGAEAPQGPIALLDPCEESRELFATLASELDREARTIDPSELSAETVEELAQVAALVLAWDLGGRSGLDLLERLRDDPRTESLRIAIAAEKPTRLMLEAALRWGADTFLCKPYDASELATRLLGSASSRLAAAC